MEGLRPIKMPSAKEKVAVELRQAILSKHMKEGEVLSLETVASQLNVSATPVREAFQILARDGLIELRRNKGAVVLGISENYIREHYELRAILESSCARMASSEGIDLQEIENAYAISCETVSSGNLDHYSDLNRSFHHEIWVAAGNSRIASLVSDLWNGLSLGNMVSEQDYAKVSLKEHGEILQAMRSHDGEKAFSEMYAHILRSRDDMLTYYT
ncbi:MAG: GntR family transcriptional regulator [Lachnospiraceae bacterium]|nr:GntR family transcriptional regulator [Lachnospiraceae bacterium]